MRIDTLAADLAARRLGRAHGRSRRGLARRGARAGGATTSARRLAAQRAGPDPARHRRRTSARWRSSRIGRCAELDHVGRGRRSPTSTSRAQRRVPARAGARRRSGGQRPPGRTPAGRSRSSRRCRARSSRSTRRSARRVDAGRPDRDPRGDEDGARRSDADRGPGLRASREPGDQVARGDVSPSSSRQRRRGLAGDGRVPSADDRPTQPAGARSGQA